MTEFEELAKLKEWEGLLDTLLRERKARFRQILAAHTSACCSPDHQPQMVSSLKGAGLDDPLVLEEKTGTTYLASMSLDRTAQQTLALAGQRGAAATRLSSCPSN